MKFLRATPVHETDEELLYRYQSDGKSDSFGRLYDRYIPLVYGLCLKYLQDEDEAQDAVMQLFEELMSKVLQHEIRVFRTWLHTVARNHCLQILRSKEHVVQVELRPDFMESDEVLHLLEEEEEEEDGQQVQALRQCMEKLPENQRVSIVRFFMEEQSYADIAEATGYPLKSVKSHIQNGKRNLKICMEQTATIE
ncbi:MAG: sigma-70 family RNA polymerase sigma factor [Tannerella sp.]|nr:sigma-70 family RNA polymerase sigma factor [Tannerella sp.]